mmetsp:Transcript_11646/g.48461  ORF Transcript_11646/g.48461 Transcript_11646/m.48461 type:complete len:202 (+) Transcript_11646:977-1582(+)
MICCPCSISGLRGTQKAASTSSSLSFNLGVSEIFNRNTNGESIESRRGRPEILRGISSSRQRGLNPDIRSSPISSLVSLTAVSRSVSPGPALPPGKATCPLQGSPSLKALLISKSSNPPPGEPHSHSPLPKLSKACGPCLVESENRNTNAMDARNLPGNTRPVCLANLLTSLSIPTAVARGVTPRKSSPLPPQKYSQNALH